MAPIQAAKPVATSSQGIASRLSSRASADTGNPSLVHHFTSAVLNIRQQIVAIPATYTPPANNPSPGTVVGIVLGVVLGIAFILWVLYTVFNANNPSGATEVEIIKRPRKSRTEARSDRTRSEVIEVSRTRARSEPRRQREVIVEEEVRRAPAPPEEDVVVVIEEHSPVRRQRRSSGYRNVDPNEFGGGRRDRRGVR
ncbi:MAG: hypothetical protein GOMPHAMPRED_003119 [Gomphillus americanus]|uniref:Uncharacterized protein n=1 Tax=Gomphillus americanus TaxID=1940652 RepID=A0A8H3I9J0_9LECA|nr:MAG: hypothetical protein GOMPHAMPRED_003119 [Gomphillus americanus]